MSRKRDMKTNDLELQGMLDKAIKKIGKKKENDICRFIPSATEGYIHHFTMRKMMLENPAQLKELINKYIIKPEAPVSLAPKQRAARGSRKKREHVFFSRSDLEQLLHLARHTGNKDLLRKLAPKRDIKTIKKDLLSSIRQGRVEQDLWDSYAEAVTLQNGINQNGESTTMTKAQLQTQVLSNKF